MKQIDTQQFCKEGLLLTGLLTSSDLPRLAAQVVPETSFEVVWQAQGTAPDLLDLTLQSVVQMQCQRCLTALQESIQVSYRFQFVADEATAQAQDAVNDEADALVHSRQFDLFELIEDEMLMALPLVSLHSICPQAGALEFKPADTKLSPFAKLKALKTVA